MLDIIKDLHLTVQNIVAGIALISQNPGENESLRWEIRNGSNQPTVIISYNLNCEPIVSESEPSRKEYKRFQTKVSEERVSQYSKLSNFSSDIFEPQVCIKIQKDDSMEEESIAERHHASLNLQCENDMAIHTSDENNCPFQPEQSVHDSESIIPDSGEVTESPSFDPNIKIKQEKETDEESLFCGSDAPNESSMDSFQAYDKDGKETMMNREDVDIFTPEVILNTKMGKNNDNISCLKNVRKNSRGTTFSDYANDSQDPVTIDRGLKLFTCNNCEKSFKQKNDLLIHVRIHTGEKPYPCSYCGKCFRDMRDRKRHERIHTGEKPYVCRHCNKRFSRNHHKISHERTHTGEKPYMCNYCGKYFTQVRSLRVHVKNSCKKNI